MQHQTVLAILLLLASWTVAADALYDLPTVVSCGDRVCLQIGGLRLSVPRSHVLVADRHPVDNRLISVRLQIPLDEFLASTPDIPVTLNEGRRSQRVRILVSIDARSFDERLQESVGRGPYRFNSVPDSDVTGTMMYERTHSPRDAWISQLFVPEDGPRETFYSCEKWRKTPPRILLVDTDPTCTVSTHIVPANHPKRMRLQYSIYRSLLDRRMDWDKKVRSYLDKLTVGPQP